MTYLLICLLVAFAITLVLFLVRPDGPSSPPDRKAGGGGEREERSIEPPRE